MKSRIPKIWLSLTLAISVAYATERAVGTETFSMIIQTVRFNANVPARFREAVTNLKTLPERMDPTCSECYQF